MTIFCDIPMFYRLKRRYVAAIFCILSALLSTLYTSNWGYIHRGIAASAIVYGYIVFFLALLYCIGSTWVNKFTFTCGKFTRRATVTLCVCYWVPLILSGCIHLWNPDYLLHAFAIFTGWMILVIIVLRIMLRDKPW